jgi:hypothetical protein
MLAEKGKSLLRAISDVWNGLMRYVGRTVLSGERTKSFTTPLSPALSPSDGAREKTYGLQFHGFAANCFGEFVGRTHKIPVYHGLFVDRTELFPGT